MLIALVFCMLYYQVEFYQFCSNYAHVAKIGQVLDHMHYIGLYRKQAKYVEACCLNSLVGI